MNHGGHGEHREIRKVPRPLPRTSRKFMPEGCFVRATSLQSHHGEHGGRGKNSFHEKEIEPRGSRGTQGNPENAKTSSPDFAQASSGLRPARRLETHHGEHGGRGGRQFSRKGDRTTGFTGNTGKPGKMPRPIPRTSQELRPGYVTTVSPRRARSTRRKDLETECNEPRGNGGHPEIRKIPTAVPRTSQKLRPGYGTDYGEQGERKLGNTNKIAVSPSEASWPATPTTNLRSFRPLSHLRSFPVFPVSPVVPSLLLMCPFPVSPVVPSFSYCWFSPCAPCSPWFDLCFWRFTQPSYARAVTSRVRAAARPPASAASRTWSPVCQ